MEVGICTMRYLYPTYKGVQTCACELINRSNMHIGFKPTVLVGNHAVKMIIITLIILFLL